MSDAAIYNAFCTAVTAFAQQFSPPLPVAFPRVPLDPPPDDGLWLEVQWFPNVGQNYGLSDDGPTLLQGFGQISVCALANGDGLMEPQLVVDALIVAFKKGTRFDRVKVEVKPSAAPPIDGPAGIMIPVTVPYRGFDN